jgi:hypothetical protein
MNAQDAIEASISENRIVHVSDADVDEVALMFECEDHRDIGDGVEDYWGTDEAGSEWRVHVHHS